MQWGTDRFANNGFNGTRSVIDVSGDGIRNNGLASPLGRDYALNNDIDTINGIVIGGSSGVFSYYVNSVIGGTNAFAMQVNIFHSLVEQLTGN